MRSSLRRKWILLLWRGLPAITVFALLLLPQAFPFLGRALEVFPPLPLLALYYWGVEHPKRLGWQVPLLAGFAHDALADLPLGLSAALWLAFRYLTALARRDAHDAGFLVTWCVGALAVFGVLFTQWLLLAMIYHRSFPAGPMFLRWAIGALLYPAMHAALYALDRRFHKRFWFVLKPV